MKRTIFSLLLSSISTSAVAIQNNLDQAKLDTVSHIYENNRSKYPDEELFTKEFYDLLFVAVDIYNQIVSDNAEDTVSEYCESAFDYLVFNAGKPIFKITNGDVNLTFKKNKNRKLVYKLECKGNNCLVSDVITENGQSHKQYMKHCIKNYKSPFE